MTRPFRPLIACAVFLLALIPASGAFAVTLAAVVNGVPITSYDVDQRVALQRVSGQTASRTAALNELIDEAIEVSEAIRLGANVSQSQVDAAFANIAQQVGMSVSQFQQALWEAGVAPDTLKQRIKSQLYWSLLVQARLQVENPVHQDDVTAQLLAQGTEQTVREYQLQQIIFVVPQNSTNAYVNQRRSEAQSFRQRFTGCENTLAQAANLRDVTVRDIGRDTSNLSTTQVQALQNTAAGHTTSPERTSLGIEVIAVCSVTEVQANEQARAEIQNQLLIDQGDQIGQDYLAQLRDRAIIIRY
jgi:peptidyl-prolyl cis-trans isomerase SurA